MDSGSKEAFYGLIQCKRLAFVRKGFDNNKETIKVVSRCRSIDHELNLLKKYQRKQQRQFELGMEIRKKNY